MSYQQNEGRLNGRIECEIQLQKVKNKGRFSLFRIG
jgi:hypothetical protein